MGSTEATASRSAIWRSKFRLSYFPHCLASFTELLQEAFGGKCQHSILGDFKAYKPGQDYVPCYFIHVLKRTD